MPTFPSRPTAENPQIDLGALSAACTRLDTDQAAAIARNIWGVQGHLKRLDTEKDDTFRLRHDSGGLILKIANPAECPEELDLQIATLLHLADRAPDLPVPRMMRAREGAMLVAVPSPDGPRLARMMTYLEGDVLDRLPPSAAEQYRIGQMNARLRLAMEDFQHPFATRRIAWDVRHLPELASLLTQIDDPRQRRPLQLAFERITAMASRIDALPRQILHNDFSRSNLLVDRTKTEPLTGIIDFGDVVETAVAIDLSTAMLNQLPRNESERGHEDMFAGPTRVFEGHIAHAPLIQDERALLPHLVFARVVTRALLTLWRAKAFPENRTYILRNTDQGWAQLEWYLSQDPAALSTRLL